MRFRGRRGFWLAALLAVLALSLAAGGCGGDNEEAATEPTPTGETGEAGADAVEVTKVAVIAPEEASDFGWNEQGVESARAAAEAEGVEIEVADGAGYEDVTPILRQLAEDGAQLIFAHASGYNTAAPEVAQELGVAVATTDAPDALAPDLVADYTTSGQEGAYLAGVLAARMTQTDVLGLVVSDEPPGWNVQSAGFALGAKSINPDVRLLYTVIGPGAYADAAGGRRVTAAVIAGGADVVFGQGDGSSFGMIQAVETATPPAGADNVWFIDVIGDKQSIDDEGVVLSSVLWDFTGPFTEMISDLKAGTYGEQNYEVSLANGAISLQQTDKIPDDVWAEIEEVKAQIESREIEVPEITDAQEVRAMMTETR